MLNSSSQSHTLLSSSADLMGLLEGISFTKRREFPYAKMGNSIAMEGVKSLYDSIMHVFKMEQLNKGICNLTGIYAMSIIRIITVVILKKSNLVIPKNLVDMSAKLIDISAKI